MNPQAKNIPTGAVQPGGSFRFPEAGEAEKSVAAANTIQLTGGMLAVIHARSAAQAERAPNPDLSVPERGTTGPIPIGDVMEPIRKIIAHPDRNRLMAEFFRRHW